MDSFSPFPYWDYAQRVWLVASCIHSRVYLQCTVCVLFCIIIIMLE
jgi:hypothetical protein